MKIKCPDCKVLYEISLADNHIATIVCTFCKNSFDVSLPERKWLFLKSRKVTKRDI